MKTTMMMKTAMIRTAISAILMAAAMIAFADDARAQLAADVRGRAIAEEADKRDYGWGDNSTEVPPVAVPLPMLDPEPSVVPGVGAS